MNQNGLLKFILPPLILILSGFMVFFMAKMKPEQEKNKPRVIVPTVKVLKVEPESVQLKIHSQGTVEAETETNLTARVSGLITFVSPNLRNGATFAENEILLRLDPVQYEAQLAEAKAALARAQLSFEQEKANSAQAERDWKSLNPDKPAPPLVLRRPQLDKAAAEVEASLAQVRLAESNLSYTEIRAPYTGRVVEKFVDLGQSVNALATKIADIYALDTVEVELPIELQDFEYLDFHSLSNSDDSVETVPVKLSASFGNIEASWMAQITRTGSRINAKNRTATVISSIDNPNEVSPPLQPGMFVEAEIFGEHLDNVYRVPRGALQLDNSLYLVSPDDHLNKVFPEIVKLDSDWVIIRDGLSSGDRICLTPLLFFVEGMEVIPVDSNN